MTPRAGHVGRSRVGLSPDLPGGARDDAAVWVVMTVLIAVTAAVARLGSILDYRQKKLGIESAAGLIIADALHPVGGAERYSARCSDAWASLRPRLPWGRSGRQISVTPAVGAADSRPDAT